jgi:tetratricopeptide (TPR) repeat protein
LQLRHEIARQIACCVAVPYLLFVPEARFAAAVREGDAAFHAFDNATARRCYQRAFAIDSTDCAVLWKLARANIDAGVAAPDNEKARWFASGERLAERCVTLFPDSSEAHFFHALSMGQLSTTQSGKRKIELSRDMKREAEATLVLAPRHWGAMHLLGRWNYEVAGVGWFSRAAARIVYGGVPPGASYEQARTWFERAIAVEPEMPINHLWLGETLIKLHDYTRARAELESCIGLDHVMWNDALTRKQARKRLGEIEDKH